MISKYFNEEGHLTDEGTALMVDAMRMDKTDLVPQELKDHLEACVSCHETVIDFYGTVAELDYSKAGVHPVLDATVQKTTIRRLIFRIAAAAVLAAFAFYFYDQFDKRQVPDDNQLAREDTTQVIEPSQFADIPKDETKINEIEHYKIPETKSTETAEIKKDIVKPEIQNNRQLFAMNYTENAEFEAFVGEVYRSGQFELIAPENETVFKENGTVNFSWKDSASKEWMILIYNNRGAEVHESVVSSENYTVKESFPPGLYYWRLETEDDLLHVGKFFIE